MCKYFSAVVTRDGKVRWCENDSHEMIISRLELADDDSSPGRKFVRIEVPDFHLWRFKLDELDTAPGWWDEREADVRAWLSEHKTDIIKGRAAYKAAIEPAGAAYKAACDTALAAYEAACEPAWAAYKAACETAGAAVGFGFVPVQIRP